VCTSYTQRLRGGFPLHPAFGSQPPAFHRLGGYGVGRDRRARQVEARDGCRRPTVLEWDLGPRHGQAAAWPLPQIGRNLNQAVRLLHQ